MGMGLNQAFLRQVNCLPAPERAIVEAFRVLVFGVLVNPMPAAVYEAIWSSATWGADERRAVFEPAFDIIYLQIGGYDFYVTLQVNWFVEYNAAVEDDSAPLLYPCPCTLF